jgi:acyl carrier protein
MNREEIIGAIRAHLADELDVDPSTVIEATNFRDDLEADSLDLYTLLQELEDRYGLKLSDQEAASIETVGDAVAMVIAKLGGEQGS